MKTLTEFNTEAKDYTNLADFVLTSKEWGEFQSGTKAVRVETYNDSGKLVSREYVLRDIDNTDEVVEDMQAVGCGYMTDTCYVARK